MSILDPKYTFVHDGTTFKNPDDWSLLRVTRRGFDKLDAPGRGYRISYNGDVGPLKTELEALSRTRTLLRGAPVGADLRVRAYDLGTQEFVDATRFFKTAPRLPVANTPGVLGIDRIVGLVDLKWGSGKDFRYAGICVCKPDSDHRDCAAVDWFDSPANMEEARDFFLQPEVRDWVQLKYLILYDRIYFGDGTSRPYTGTYHRHVHISVYGGIPGAACG